MEKPLAPITSGAFLLVKCRRALGLEDQARQFPLDAFLGVAIATEGVRQQGAGLIALGAHGDREKAQKAEALGRKVIALGVEPSDSFGQKPGPLESGVSFKC